MSLLAVNFVLGLTTAQIGGLSGLDADAYERIRPAVVTLYQGGVEKGMAALIDSDGLYVAHLTLLDGNTVEARLFSGRMIRLEVRGQDGYSQLILLKTVDWKPTGIRPVTVASSDLRGGTTLIAVLANGPMRSELVSLDRVGVSLRTNTRRMVPLSEIRFEAPPQLVAGALLFTRNGDLFGTLSATLNTQNLNSNLANNLNNTFAAGGVAGKSVAGGFGGGRAGTDVTRFGLNSQYGPGHLTVAYTPGIDVLRRTVDGFRSPSHEVEYPTLGVWCRDEIGGGARIEKVLEGLSAEHAGLHIGDVILSIGGSNIRNQVDFARVMFRQQPGEKVTLRMKRGNRQFLADVVIGRSKE